MNTIIRYTWAILCLLTLWACQREDLGPSATIGADECIISVQAPMQDALRSSFSPVAGGLDMQTTWREGDKIHFYALQDRRAYDLGESPIFDLDQSTGRAKVKIATQIISRSEPFTLVGLHGHKGVALRSQIYLDASSLLGKPLDGFSPPLCLVAEITNGSDLSAVQSFQFRHYGAYELTHIRNESTEDLHLSEVYWQDSAVKDNQPSAKRPWTFWEFAYDPIARMYEEVLGVLDEFSLSPSFMRAEIDQKAHTIPVGSESVFVSWSIPNPKQSMSEATVISAKIKQGKQMLPIQSGVYAAAKGKALRPGHSYHLYTKWNGKALVIDGEMEEKEDEAPLQLEYDRLETEMQPGLPPMYIRVTAGKATEVSVGDPKIIRAEIAPPDGQIITVYFDQVGSTTLTVSDGKNSVTIPVIIRPYTPDDTSIPKGVVIRDGVLIKWPCEAIPESGHVAIPNSVTSIGVDAFYECASLTNVVIPSSVTSIGDWAFARCTSLTNIVIPNSVTSIGERAFASCMSLTSIVIPSSVTSIGVEAFAGCTSLPGIVIPNSVTSIGIEAFAGCTSLTNIVIPNSVTNIGADAFAGCTSLTSINIPSSVTSIKDGAFAGCTSLTSIVIPSSVTSIEAATFSRCTSLTSINIPSSVTKIEGHAFLGCTSLPSVVIPSSVKSLGEGAFDWCSNLQAVSCQATTPPKATSLGYSGRLNVPRGSKHLYEGADGWQKCYPIVEVDF